MRTICSFILIPLLLLLCFSCSSKQSVHDDTILKAVSYIREKGIKSFGMDYTKQNYSFALKYPAKDDFGKNFVSAFILSALDRKTESELFNETASLLISKQGSNGLWSFDDHGISTDSDTTLTVLISLMQTGTISDGKVQKAILSVRSIYLRHCGLASINNPKDHSNFKIHLEPTANYLFFISLTGDRTADAACIADGLIKNQNNDGSFDAYWYPSKYYATFLAIRALSEYREKSDIPHESLASVENAVKKASDFLNGSVNIDGGWGNQSNATDTAFAIMSLKIAGKTENTANISGGLKWLRSSQNNDGSWDGSVIFNYYYTQCESRKCPEPWHDKDRKLISTSLALKALRTFSTNL